MLLGVALIKVDPISEHMRGGGVHNGNFYIKLSRGEICVANFIPPVNGASQGNYFQPVKIPKMAVLRQKRQFQKNDFFPAQFPRVLT